MDEGKPTWSRQDAGGRSSDTEEGATVVPESGSSVVPGPRDGEANESAAAPEAAEAAEAPKAPKASAEPASPADADEADDVSDPRTRQFRTFDARKPEAPEAEEQPSRENRPPRDERPSRDDRPPHDDRPDSPTDRGPRPDSDRRPPEGRRPPGIRPPREDRPRDDRRPSDGHPGRRGDRPGDPRPPHGSHRPGGRPPGAANPYAGPRPGAAAPQGPRPAGFGQPSGGPRPHTQHSPQHASQHGPHPQHGPQGPRPHGPVPPPQGQRYDPWGGEQPQRERARGGGKGLVVGAILIALIAGGVGGGLGIWYERSGGVAGTIELDQSPVDGNLDRAPDSVAGIARTALPGVVTIHVSGGDEQGTGTGFVLDRSGHILTNNHVVQPAAEGGEITVTFAHSESARAEIVGRDSGYDLAVLKVKGVSNLKPLPLGNSDSVAVGDPVIAIGAPYNLANTVTSGIISAKERPITAGGETEGSDVSYVDALQTDAPINPGNSGGPLLDRKGRVIGINSAIRAADAPKGGSDGSQGGSIGLGFAIPVNQGKRVAEELINTGKARHPVIGVTLDMQYTGAGARVGDSSGGKPSITPGGPAATAGIRPGDVITHVDGTRVHNGEELIIKIRSHRPGDRLGLTVERDGSEMSVDVVLGASDGD
ncbi:trypsin-like peptidase domain-containing protein [Streptomyces polyrhachis]|uniref:Trypsin-like peptidase domain-containing protein n=1 Tax=Streptomyces polyrhachis TaxID=1282885 RepID=A0ABW2GLS7_9ACTN